MLYFKIKILPLVDFQKSIFILKNEVENFLEITNTVNDCLERFIVYEQGRKII